MVNRSETIHRSHGKHMLRVSQCVYVSGHDSTHCMLAVKAKHSLFPVIVLLLHMTTMLYAFLCVVCEAPRFTTPFHVAYDANANEVWYGVICISTVARMMSRTVGMGTTATRLFAQTIVLCTKQKVRVTLTDKKGKIVGHCEFPGRAHEPSVPPSNCPVL